MKKRIPLLAFLILVLVCSVAGLAACGGGGLKVTAESNGNGTVALSASSAQPGESVTVTLTPDDGYIVESVLLNDGELEVEDNSATFFMPNTDAHVVVTFGKIKYKIEISSVSGGEVVCDAAGYAEGESVTLTVAPDYGYALSSLTVGGRTVTVTDNKYTFTMPASAVAVAPVFATTAAVKAKPSGSLLTLQSQAPAGGTAKADVFVEFGGEALLVRAFVSDKKVISAKDGLCFYFGTTDFANASVSDKNLKVSVTADGSVTVQRGASGSFISANVSGITAEVAPWSRESGRIEGYELTLGAAYSSLGVTASNAEGKLTLLPVLVNGDKTGLAFGANEGTIDEYHLANNADTYPAVTSQGFADNYYMFGRGAFGSYKNVVIKGTHWNTDADYEDNNPSYASRKVVLGGHDGSDNNIAMPRSAGRTSYARATFKVAQVCNPDDRHPKFGFMVYDTAKSDSGVMFYVDAEMSGDRGNALQNIIGTSLGYVSKNNAVWAAQWNKLAGTDGSFNLGTKQITLGITYNKGFVYFYLGDTQVGVAAYKAAGDIVIGIKSFGLGLEVTDYFATNDPNNPEFIAHNTRVDGVTVGDSEDGYAYTEGWSIVGDIASNSGAGDQKIYVKGVRESANLYAEANMTSPGKTTASDAWTKAGMMLENENYLVFAYVDLADNGNRTDTRFAVRNLTGANAGRWTWDLGINGRNGTTIEDKAVTLGIAKIGATIYMLENGKTVASYTDKSLENERFVAGVFGCNRAMTVDGASGTTDPDEIKDKLGLTVPEEVTFDGVLNDAIWTEKVLAARQTFGENKSKGTKVDVAAVMGQKGVFVAATLYTATMQTKIPSTTPLDGTANVAFKLETATDGNKNGPLEYIAFYDGLDGGVSTSVSFRNAAAKVESATLAGGAGYKTVVEFYIPYECFPEYSEGATELAFYVWSIKTDNKDLGAMNATYKTTKMVVTAEGLAVKSI